MEKVRLGLRKSDLVPNYSGGAYQAHLLRQRNYPTEHAAHNP